MAIKPVDFQVMIPKTVEIARISNEEAHRSQVMQFQQAASAQQKAEESLKQVNSSPRAQDVRITEKQSERRREKEKEEGRKKGQDKGEGNKYKKEWLNKEIKSSTIDIKI